MIQAYQICAIFVCFVLLNINVLRVENRWICIALGSSDGFQREKFLSDCTSLLYLSIILG